MCRRHKFYEFNLSQEHIREKERVTPVGPQ